MLSLQLCQQSKVSLIGNKMDITHTYGRIFLEIFYNAALMRAVICTDIFICTDFDWIFAPILTWVNGNGLEKLKLQNARSRIRTSDLHITGLTP